MNCEVGNYLESGSCYTCPERCTSCNNSEVCYNCTVGYYGLSCDKNCSSSMCLNNTCNKDSGACLHGCIKGYFLSGLSCYPCASKCKTCANFSNNCLECKEGYYGPSCQQQCSYCKDSICNRDHCTYGCGDGFVGATGEACNPCNENCKSCYNLFDNCTACEDGHFGTSCQFTCSDCSSCDKANGACPASKSTTERTISSNSSAKTAFHTTNIFTTSSSQISASQYSKSSDVFSTTSSQPLTNMASNTLIIYAAAGGGGGLVIIIMVIVVVAVCKRRGRAKQLDTVTENIEMAENENYISADDIDGTSQNSTNEHNEEKQNKQEDNDALYSLPKKMRHPTMVTMDTRSVDETEGSSSTISPTIPVKSNMYFDLV